MEGVPELRAQTRAILASIDRALARIDGLIEGLADGEQHRRLQRIPGVGKLTGAGLLAAYSQGEFRSVDAFVAFLGLDLVANDSGAKKGRRRLSKLGDSETRRLAYMCAMAAIRTPAWRHVYDGYRARYSTTGALVALSRRIVRTAWSMLSHQTDFEQTRISGQPAISSFGCGLLAHTAIVTRPLSSPHPLSGARFIAGARQKLL